MKKQNLLRTGYVASAMIIISACGLNAAPDLEKAFGRMDADGNGTISSEEFSQSQLEWAQSRGKKEGKSEAQIAEKQAKIEKNAPKRFEKADSNSDGELSMEEFVAMREQAAKK